MDANRMKLAVFVAIAMATVFAFLFLRRFLGLLQLSARVIVGLAIITAILIAFWSARQPPTTPTPAYQSQVETGLRR